jgi:hypothetical protein
MPQCTPDNSDRHASPDVKEDVTVNVLGQPPSHTVPEVKALLTRDFCAMMGVDRPRAPFSSNNYNCDNIQDNLTTTPEVEPMPSDFDHSERSKARSTTSKCNRESVLWLQPPIGSPVIEVLLNGKSTSVIVDTGASRTICSDKQIRMIDSAFESKLRPVDTLMKSATGHDLQCLGAVEISLEIGEIRQPLEVLVFQDKPDHFLLGQDFMLDQVTIVDGRTFILKSGTRTVEVPISYKSKRKSIRSKVHLTIEPNETAL